MIEINELRQLAQAASHPTTKGRWIRLFGERTVYDRMEDGCRGIPVVSTDKHPPSPFEAACLDFIAAANPAAVSELLDRLEVAEKDIALKERVIDSLGAELNAVAKERDALRVRIEAMERQEPGAIAKWTTGGVAVHIVGDVRPGDILYLAPGAQPAPSALAEAIIADMQAQHDSELITENDSGEALIRLDGAIAAVEDNFALAQPAPSVPEGWKLVPIEPTPTALLVAVANLVAQMEIISRVGFVDTPNDKDSCAAFCIAEGTWLELMRCVESLASALEAAPETKP